MLVGMLTLRNDFDALGDPRTRWRALGALLLLITTSGILGLALIGARSNALAQPFRPLPAAEQVAYGLVGAQGPLRWENDRSGRRADDLVGTPCWRWAC